MELDWQVIDRWIFGEAWTGSKAVAHAEILCEGIGPRWAALTLGCAELSARKCCAGARDGTSRGFPESPVEKPFQKYRESPNNN